MIYFKKNLHFLRLKKGMFLKDIAKDAGFTTSQWNNYELGFSVPKFLDLIKISEYFNIAETDLIHVDLEFKNKTELNHSENQKEDEYSKLELINVQNKLIKIQEEKIDELQKKLKTFNSENI